MPARQLAAGGAIVKAIEVLKLFGKAFRLTTMPYYNRLLK